MKYPTAPGRSFDDGNGALRQAPVAPMGSPAQLPKRSDDWTVKREPGKTGMGYIVDYPQQTGNNNQSATSSDQKFEAIVQPSIYQSIKRPSTPTNKNDFARQITLMASLTKNRPVADNNDVYFSSTDDDARAAAQLLTESSQTAKKQKKKNKKRVRDDESPVVTPVESVELVQKRSDSTNVPSNVHDEGRSSHVIIKKEKKKSKKRARDSEYSAVTAPDLPSKGLDVTNTSGNGCEADEGLRDKTRSSVSDPLTRALQATADAVDEIVHYQSPSTRNKAPIRYHGSPTPKRLKINGSMHDTEDNHESGRGKYTAGQLARARIESLASQVNHTPIIDQSMTGILRPGESPFKLSPQTDALLGTLVSSPSTKPVRAECAQDQPQYSTELRQNVFKSAARFAVKGGVSFKELKALLKDMKHLLKGMEQQKCLSQESEER